VEIAPGGAHNDNFRCHSYTSKDMKTSRFFSVEYNKGNDEITNGGQEERGG
jgi:hypothetical protein